MQVPKYAGAEVFDSMPVHHVRSITTWTGSAYTKVTGPILKGTATEEIRSYRDLLDSALQAAPKKYRGEISRGLNLTPGLLDEAWVQKHIDAKDSGEVIDSKLPGSWKRGGSGAWGNYAQLHIVDSKQGVYVNPISLHHGQSEDEVMMPSFKYRVVKHKKYGGIHHFWLEEVEE